MTRHRDSPSEPDPSASEPAPSGPVTVLLRQVSSGDAAAHDKLLTLVYDELHSLAEARMRNERQGHTLQPTALVNEAYVRLLRFEDVPWQGKAHFFRAAADSMRRILVDHARSRNAVKRGGGQSALRIANVADALAEGNADGLLALDGAIERLRAVDDQAAEVVRLKFYAGLTDADTGSALGISERSVRREWAFARGWLRDALEREADRGRT